MDLKEVLELIDWFFSESRWLKFLVIGTIFGVLLSELAKYIFSISWFWGFAFGCFISLIDFINGHNEGFSVMEWIVEFVSKEGE